MYWFMAITPLALLVAGLPIYLVLLATVVGTLIFFLPLPSTVIAQVMFGSVSNFELLAIPFFIFAGALMARGGMARRLIAIVTATFGRFTGSAPITTVGASALYGSISGSTAATVAALGPLFYPQLRRSGYSPSFSAAIVACAGYLDNIIPPSIAMILFCAAAEQSILKLFAAGVVPGIVLALVMMTYLYGYARWKGIVEGEPFSLAHLIRCLRDGAFAIGAPVLIFGGLYGGVFSPTEAAGAACVYVGAVSMLVYREVTWRDLWEVSVSSMYLTAQIFLIVAVAGLFSWLLTTSGVAAGIKEFFVGAQMPTWLLLLAINVLLLIVGCFVDTASALLVLTPVLLPIAMHAGVDPIHFGIVMIVNLSIGTFTPPFGVNIFVAQSVLPVPLRSIYAGLVPLIAVSIVGLLIITYFPKLSLWLVQ
jgi:C4-dicarboxylate transporter DctM subunit